MSEAPTVGTEAQPTAFNGLDGLADEATKWMRDSGLDVDSDDFDFHDEGYKAVAEIWDGLDVESRDKAVSEARTLYPDYSASYGGGLGDAEQFDWKSVDERGDPEDVKVTMAFIVSDRLMDQAEGKPVPTIEPAS